MPYKPFLSHKRSDADALRVLHQELRIRGAGGWQDTSDLLVGQATESQLERAINDQCGGFIWWATERSLDSEVITRLEIPAGVRRAQAGDFPFVPLFVDLDPGQDRPLIEKALGAECADAVLDFNGLVMERGGTIKDFATEATRRYVRDLIRCRPSDDLRIAITGGRSPTGAHDITLDWRELLDDGGRFAGDGTGELDVIRRTLIDVREAAQSGHEIARIEVEPHLRQPLAALVGWELNRLHAMDLTNAQPGRGGRMLVPDVKRPDPVALAITGSSSGGRGPVVLGVSAFKDGTNAVRRYAETIDACAWENLHVAHELNAGQICSLVDQVVSRLADLNMSGVAKHLVIVGPVALGVRLGASSHGVGKTYVPFWDGASGYSGGITVG